MVSKTVIDEALTLIGEMSLNGESIAQNPLSTEDLNLLYALGFGLYQAGDYLQAKTIFNQLVVAKPLSNDYWKGLGSCLLMEKLYKEALTSWSMCALLDDKEPSSHFHAAECLYAIGETNEAIKALKCARERASLNESLLEKIETLLKQWSKES